MPFSARFTSTTAICALTAGLLATTAVAPAAAAEQAASAAPRAAETLIVGGTTFPSVSAAMMASFTNTFSPNLVNVSYPAALAPFSGDISLGTSVAAGAATLVQMIQTSVAATGSIVVWGISQGALVINAAAKVLTDSPNRPDPGALTLVRVADPATPLTGMLNFLPDAVMSLLQTGAEMRTAVDTPFNTVIIVNTYDAFSDFPTTPNPVAVLNALAGLFYRHGQTAFVDLQSVPAENISVTVNSYGATTTTYRVPSPDLPLTRPLRDAGVPAAWVDALDQVLQPMVDAGYATTPLAPAPATATAAAATATAAISAERPIAVPVRVSPPTNPVLTSGDAAIGTARPAGSLRVSTTRDGAARVGGHTTSRPANAAATRSERGPVNRHR